MGPPGALAFGGNGPTPPGTPSSTPSPSSAAPSSEPAQPSEAQRALRAALQPSPAAFHRAEPPAEPRLPSQLARRRSDQDASQIGPPLPAYADDSFGGPTLQDPIPAGMNVRPAPSPAAPPLTAAPPLPTVPTAATAPEAYPTAGDLLVEAPVVAEAAAATTASVRSRSSYEFEPPPTRIVRGEGLADRPFTPPRVVPVPEIPEPGPLPAAKYFVRFVRARMQRRTAIKKLGEEIKQDTGALDQVLGALGRQARSVQLEGRVFFAENNAITAAEQRMAALDRERAELDGRKAEEGSRYADIEKDRNSKLGEAERTVEEAQRELAQLETQRRGLRERRKELERKQKASLKAAEERDEQAGSSGATEDRNDLRRSAESHRREAAALEPDRQEIDRKLASVERPIADASAKLDAAKAELDAAKRSLNDAREGYSHRLAELDAEHKRKGRDYALAEAEVARRLITLGTLVNLNRLEDPRFSELYERIDRLRGAITARSTEIEKLTSEREAYDRGSMVRGGAVLGSSVIALIALLVLLRALL